MNRTFSALLVGFAALLLPAAAHAQGGFDFSDEGGGDTGGEAEGEGEPEGFSFGEGEEAAEGAEGTEGAEGAEGEGGGFLEGLGGIEEDSGTGPIREGPRPTESAEEIYAVQQVYALRINRLEISPSIAATLNDPFMSHTAIGVGLNYWFTNVLAVGANFLWYQGFESESDLNFFVRRSTRLAIPITQWQMGAHLNFTYVPFYGKFAAFNEFIFQWDAYVLGGVGLMRTRPIPVIDPELREFDFGNRVAFNLGLGIRIFLTRFLTFFTEFRDYMYLERFENLEVALGDGRSDPSTWYDDGSTFTNNMTVQVGFSIFFPFTFEYRLPK